MAGMVKRSTTTAGGRITAPAHGLGAPPGQAAKRGPQLTHDGILVAALALVDAEGLTGFTTRRLGEALGVQAMSIYHHFPSKQHLLDALVDHAVNAIELPAAGPEPAERLRRFAYAWRVQAHRHPKLFPLLAVHRLDTPVGVRFIESVLGLVEALIPDRELAARFFRIFGYYLRGSVLGETTGYAQGPSVAAPASEAFVAEHCPRLRAAAPYFAPRERDKTFALGLEALLAEMSHAGQHRSPSLPRPRVRPKL
jgi:AcrR family transcriptional regulator